MEDTILVTGGTGYLGSWVVKKLLEKGYNVRITARDKSKVEKYAFLEEIAASSSGTLSVYEANLLVPGAFDEAAKGSDAIFHIASPFTLRFKDPVAEIINPAIKGTQNVLGAASSSGTVKKVILTSSVAAVHGDNIDMKEKGLSEFTEDDYNDSSTETHQPYSYSKIKAELEAWDIDEKQEDWKLVVINPSFIMGPPLSDSSNSESIQFMKDILKGKMLIGAPDLEFGYVDVRDVATAHILAYENNDANGRHIIAERVMNVMALAKVIKKLYPGKYPLPLMQSPKFMLYLVGWAFGLSGKYISRNVGHHIKLNNNKSKDALGLDYTPIEKTVEDMILGMKKLALIKD
jgi:nucleoside-diphosphate-sugar epimerase